MNNEILMEKIVQSLSLQIEEVQNDNTVQVTGTSKGTPIKLKVKVRKKDQADTYNFISVPKRQLACTAEKMRLVNSDQTIMSFDMIMDTDQTESPKKHRKKFFKLLRPGICLGNVDDEKESYQPSKYKNKDKTTRSDEMFKKQLALSKKDYFDISTAVSKRHQNFLGKCKPGGCLDPPFSEDKYSYTPIKRQLELETSTLTAKKICLGDDVRTLRQDSLQKSTSSEDKLSGPDNTTDVKIIQNHPQNNSILNIYRAESVNTSLSLTYSNSIITYPPPLNASEIRLNYEKSMQQRTSSDNKSKNSYNEFSQTYFMSPKEIINQIENNNSILEILRDNNARNSILRAFRVKSETGSTIEKDYFSSSVQSDKNIGNVCLGVSGIIASATKQVEQFGELASTTIKTAPTVDDIIIGKRQEAVINYVHKDNTILLSKSGSKNELVHQATPITSSTHELISIESTLKSESITIKSIDTILNPSIRSSLAETNLNISKILPDQLSQQEKLILSHAVILPPFLEENNKRSSTESRISKNECLNKTIKLVDGTVLNNEDNLPKTLAEQLAQNNLILNKSPEIPYFDDNDKSLDKRSSTQVIINKSNSIKPYETVEFDDIIVLSNVDNEIKRDPVDNEYKENIKDENQQVLGTGRDLEVGHIFEKNVEDTEEKPSIIDDGVSNKLTPAHKSAHNENDNVFGKDIESTPTTSINESIFKIKETNQDFIFKSDDLSSKSIIYLFSKSNESEVPTLINIANFDQKENYPTKNVLTEKLLTNHPTDGDVKPGNSEITLKSNTSKAYKSSKDTSKNGKDHNISNPNNENYYERPVSSENDEISDVENSVDRKSMLSTLLPVTKSTINQILDPNNEALVTKYDQNPISQHENEDCIKQKNPPVILNITEELKEIVKETRIQPLEDAHATSMLFPRQAKDSSQIDTSSHYNTSADQSLGNSDVSIEKDVSTTIEDNLLTKEIVPSAEIIKTLLLQLPEKALESEKFQEILYINSKTDVAENLPQKLFHDKENQSMDSIVENKISNTILDKPTRTFEKKSNTSSQMLNTKEEPINSNAPVSTEDILKMSDTDRDVNSDKLEQPTNSLISYPNILYGNTNIAEPIEVHDFLSHKISISKIDGVKSKNAILQERDLKKSDLIKHHEPNNILNDDVTATFTLHQKISNEFAKQNLISEQTRKISDKHDEPNNMINDDVTASFTLQQKISNEFAKQNLISEQTSKISDKHDEPHNMINDDVTASFTLQQKISIEFAKRNLINEQTSKISDSKLIISKPLEMQYKTIPQYLPNLKHKQNLIIDNIGNKEQKSNAERPEIEELSSIFDVVAIPDTKKIKEEITALKYRSDLYTPSENTLTKALNKDIVAIDLAFHSYVNSKDKVILKTFDSDNEPQRYSNDRLITIKSDMNLSNNEMKIPIDSENSLFLQIRNVKTMGHIAQNVLKDTDELILDTKMIANNMQTLETQNPKAPNLHYIYEKELLPLQNAMKDLKDEIDHLAGYSLKLKDNLITRKPKPSRLSNINKRCVCLKRLF